MSSHYANMWDINRQSQRATWYSAGVPKHHHFADSSCDLAHQRGNQSSSSTVLTEHCADQRAYPPAKRQGRLPGRSRAGSQRGSFKEAIKPTTVLKKVTDIRDCSILWFNRATKETTASQEKACILRNFQTPGQLHKASSYVFNISHC